MHDQKSDAIEPKVEPKIEPWLTVKQMAEYSQFSVQTIYGEIRAGRLRAARIGGRREIRGRHKWCDEWLEACATPVEIVR
jgi:excisionase family DNA binding protein